MEISRSSTAAQRRLNNAFTLSSDDYVILDARQQPVSPSLTNESFWRGHLATIILCTILTTFFVWARVLVKWKTGTKWFSDDWTCLVAWVAYIGFAVTPFAMIPYGLGLHVWDLTSAQFEYVTMWLYGSSVAYCPATFMIKATLLLLIARVFSSSSPKTSRNIHIFIFALLIAYLPIQLIKMFICTPIAAQWDKASYPQATCLNQRKVFIADLVLAIITDLVILILPVPLVWGYSFDLKKKIKISALLGAGGAATATTAYRMYYVVKYVSSTDSTYDAAILDLLCMMELTIGMVCACLPTLNMFFMRKRSGNHDRSAEAEHTRGHRHNHRRYPFRKQRVEHDENRPRTIGSEDTPSKASRLRRYRQEYGMDKTWREPSGHGKDMERQPDGISTVCGEEMTRMTSATTAVGSTGLRSSRRDSKPGAELHHARWGSSQAGIYEDVEDYVNDHKDPTEHETSGGGLGSLSSVFDIESRKGSGRPGGLQRTRSQPTSTSGKQPGDCDLPQPGHLHKIDSDLGRKEGWLSPVPSRREEAIHVTQLARHTTSTKKSAEAITENHPSWGEDIPSRPGTSENGPQLFSIFADPVVIEPRQTSEGHTRQASNRGGSDWIWDGRTKH